MRTPVKEHPTNTIALSEIWPALKGGAILATLYDGTLTFAVTDDGWWWFTRLSNPGYVHSRTKGLDAFLQRLVPKTPGDSTVILFENAAELSEYIYKNGIKL